MGLVNDEKRGRLRGRCRQQVESRLNDGQL